MIKKTNVFQVPEAPKTVIPEKKEPEAPKTVIPEKKEPVPVPEEPEARPVPGTRCSLHLGQMPPALPLCLSYWWILYMYLLSVTCPVGVLREPKNVLQV